jgi:probable rRNA maturation factor
VIEIDINNEQNRLTVDERRLRAALSAILADAGFARATISLAIVDDPAIHDLNRRFLQHDYPTDVLSFVLEESSAGLDGEIIVSADTATASAPRYGWRPEDELLLYVIHGGLHLVGYDDKSPAAAGLMRDAETRYLARFDLSVGAVAQEQLVGKGNQS